MASLTTPLGITAVILIVIGIILAVIAIVMLIIRQNELKPWWIWALLIIGVAAGIIGAILLAYVYMYPAQTTTVVTKTVEEVKAP